MRPDAETVNGLVRFYLGFFQVDRAWDDVCDACLYQVVERLVVLKWQVIGGHVTECPEPPALEGEVQQ